MQTYALENVHQPQSTISSSLFTVTVICVLVYNLALFNIYLKISRWSMNPREHLISQHISERKIWMSKHQVTFFMYLCMCAWLHTAGFCICVCVCAWICVAQCKWRLFISTQLTFYPEDSLWTCEGVRCQGNPDGILSVGRSTGRILNVWKQPFLV